MTSSWMLRAAAAPERFLARGFTRFVSPVSGTTTSARASKGLPDFGVTLPRDLATFVRIVARRRRIGDFVVARPVASFAALLAAARRSASAFARLTALLAGAVAFGETSSGDIYVYFIGGRVHGIVATIDPRTRHATLVCRGAAELAVLCAFRAANESPPAFTPFDADDERAVADALANAEDLGHILAGDDERVRAKAKEPGQRSVLGAMLEGFFFDPSIETQARSPDRIVREASALLDGALAKPASAAARELARRRRLVHHVVGRASSVSLETTRAIVARLDAIPVATESFAALRERDELLLALAELGDRRIVPELHERARGDDAGAVDMLAAFGDRTLVASLIDLLGREVGRVRLHEAAVVRALAAAGAKEALPVLRGLLDASPLSGWRAGLERGVLVRELVSALGELDDVASAAPLVAILESTSHEYRALVPFAAHAVGRLRHAPALDALERRLFSPKDTVTCEAVWTVGAIAEAHPEVRERSLGLLERLTGHDPAIEATRMVALAKARGGKPKVAATRRAIDRALWEPAFRQDESSRRRAWALRALEELAAISNDGSAFFLGQQAIRHLVTRDDHRVRRAALRAFAAWKLDVPETRPYYAVVLPELERRGGLESLLEAVGDPLGLFRHNVAARLAEIGDARVIRPLAEATERLFAEPPTSTYEYDDAPPELVAFVRALAKLNRPEGNDVLIEGLASANHQVRAVIAENAPDDPRFVPELMAMLGDSRSFLRSRAEKSLRSLGALEMPTDPNTTEVLAVKPAVALRNGA